MKIYFIECPNQIFIFYFIFHFLFFIFQVSKIDWILHNYIYCNNIKVNDLNYYYSKYLYFSHFTISFTLFSYSIYIFFSYIYFLYFNKIFISKHCLYKFNINIYYFYYYFKKRNLFSKSYIPRENKNIYFYLSVSKIHFPRSWWKDCRKSETTQHTMILRTRTSSIPFSITGTDLQRIYHSQIQKSIWSSLLYHAPIPREKIPVQPYRHGISLPFFTLEFQLFIYREQTVNTNENSIHKVLRLNEML